MSDEKTLEQMIDEIPGEDGWWKNSSQEDYQAAARHLAGRGMTDMDIYEMLQTLYWAAADCFGS